MILSWSANDGDGSGLAWQQLKLEHPGEGAAGATNLTFAVAPPLLTLGAGGDSSNWWLTVIACDAMGNAATNSAGPFWIDATPPDVSAATLATTWGFSGRYVVGAPLPLTLSNAVDALSGLAGYTFVNASRPDVASLNVASNAVLWRDVVWNATNLFSVTASDVAGNVSAPVTAAMLVLDPASDTDGDGLAAAEEEIMGTSPLTPSARFAILAVTPAAGGAGLRLAWPAVAGRFYTVERAATLTGGAWSGAAGLTALAGSNGVMTVVTTPAAAPVFYRVRVTR
jgi:hypothetical protein